MPGKRSYVNAVTGCMTQDQIRRQARDRAFLPQPPPPPLSEAPRHSAWADIVDRCDCATQCDLVFTAMPADPPLSGKFLDTINRALGIIELQCRPCPDACASPIEAQPKQPIRQLLLEPLIVDSGCTPGFPPLDDAPFTMTEISCLPPAPLLEDAPLALKEVSYYDDYTGEDFTANTEQLTGNFYIGEEYGEDFTNPADLSALDAEGPFTPAQNIVLDREINATVMKILDPLIDMIIAKVVVLIEANVKTAIDPICHDFSCRLDALQGEQTAIAAEEEEGPNSAAQHNLDNDFRLIVQTSMKRYCFKHTQYSLKHNSMQIDRLHVENGSELVHYFEKLVRDEISTSNSAPDLSDPNLMHSDQFNTGDTLQDCTDFDEPMNDLHSTAACAQLLQYSLSGSQEPTP